METSKGCALRIPMVSWPPELKHAVWTLQTGASCNSHLTGLVRRLRDMVLILHGTVIPSEAIKWTVISEMSEERTTRATRWIPFYVHCRTAVLGPRHQSWQTLQVILWNWQLHCVKWTTNELLECFQSGRRQCCFCARLYVSSISCL